MTVTHAIAHDGGILLGKVRDSDCTQGNTKAHQGGDLDRRWWRSALSECGLANSGQGRTDCESATSGDCHKTDGGWRHWRDREDEW
jgi:hypothetical protein